eukprot:UN21327
MVTRLPPIKRGWIMRTHLKNLLKNIHQTQRRDLEQNCQILQKKWGSIWRTKIVWTQTRNLPRRNLNPCENTLCWRKSHEKWIGNHCKINLTLKKKRKLWRNLLSRISILTQLTQRMLKHQRIVGSFSSTYGKGWTEI